MASIFAIFLVFLSLATGLIWLLDAKVLAPRREAALEKAQAELGDALDDKSRDKIIRQSFLAETAQSIFPVVLAITIFRSFIYEPFQIPSGSMKPTLLVGDFILVEKFAYGLKDPVTRTELVATGKPERGDVAVFKYPVDPMIDYIKRVVGLPGDTIIYRDKTLFIKPSCEREPDVCNKHHRIETEHLDTGKFVSGMYKLERYKSKMLGVEHEMLVNPQVYMDSREYYRQAGTRVDEWVVPPGQYFMLGDNRDNSRDSRFWGFVPEEYFVGRAVFIWTSFEKHPNPQSWFEGFFPVGVRFERIGSL